MHLIANFQPPTTSNKQIRMKKTTVNPAPKTPKTPPTCAWGAVTCCDVCFQSVPFFLRWLLRLNFAVHRFYHGIFHSSVDERLWGGEN